MNTFVETASPAWRELLREVNGGRPIDGVPGMRDPDAVCVDFDPIDDRGTYAAGDGRCDTDGHYLCRECRHISAQSVE